MQPNAKGLLVTHWTEVAVTLVFGAIVVSGIGLVALMLSARQRLQELAIRERIALIERGLVPSPEADPARFEKLMSVRRPANPSGARYQSAGVLIMGLGAALAVMLAFTARQIGVGIGLGGALAILGLAIFINGALISAGPPVDTRRSDS
jgi:hypothetical protein